MGDSGRCTRHPENRTNGLRCAACLGPFCRLCVDAVDVFYVCRGCRAPEAGEARQLTLNAQKTLVAASGDSAPPSFHEPDSVAIDASTTAPLGVRITALVLDLMLVGFLLSFVESLIDQGGDSWVLLRALALTVGYEAMFVQEKGQTIGKAIAGIEVVALDGTRAGPNQVWLRAVVKVAQYSCCGAPFLLVPFLADGRGIHDIVAATRVVRKAPELPRELGE